MRATVAPEQWKKLLEAVANDDYELAHKICVTYGFDGRVLTLEKPEVPFGHYAAMSPEGKVLHNEFASVLSRSLGFSSSYITMKIRETKGNPLKQGKMKGWVFWKE
uniref:hypothetical protein n=1 Tax=Jeotgalibaca porci TaxID=1868793 RepID=UPI00359FAC05